MSACRFWWIAGDVQWCDMGNGSCRCNGWDDCCDLKKANSQSLRAPLDSIIHKQKTEHRKMRRAA